METIIHYKRLKRKKARSKKAGLPPVSFFQISRIFIDKNSLKCYIFFILSII